MRDLAGTLEDAGWREVRIATRVVVFTPDLAVGYFTQTGRSARQAGVIDAGELDRWAATIAELHSRGRLFGTIGYFLFTARA